MARVLTLHLSALTLTIRFEQADGAFATMQRVWEHTQRIQYLSSAERLDYSVDPSAAGFVLVLRDRKVEVERVEDIAPVLEAQLYDDLVAVHDRASLTVVHAACCNFNGRAIVFMGASGAGKSTMSRAAVRAGLRYFADEHTITDGDWIWGVPRTIHMDVQPEDAPRHAWHQGADFDTYRCRNPHGHWFRLPLIRLSDEQVALHPVAVRDAVLVQIEHGSTDSLKRSSAAERIHGLQDCFVRAPSVARLATLPLGYRLTWADPDRAMALLLEQLG